VTPKCLWFFTNLTFSLLKTIQGLLAAWLVEKIIHSVFFDGCTQQEYNKIEQIQHEAARIITGIPKFSSLESLYFETG
jgi:hypothetical protein